MSPKKYELSLCLRLWAVVLGARDAVPTASITKDQLLWAYGVMRERYPELFPDPKYLAIAGYLEGYQKQPDLDEASFLAFVRGLNADVGNLYFYLGPEFAAILKKCQEKALVPV